MMLNIPYIIKVFRDATLVSKKDFLNMALLKVYNSFLWEKKRVSSFFSVHGKYINVKTGSLGYRCCFKEKLVFLDRRKDFVLGRTSFIEHLLFNVFINDIFMFIEKSEICNFADDMVKTYQIF